MSKASGVIKTAAKRVGVSESDYLRQQEAGNKWCTRCRQWQARSEFGRDASRSDGLTSMCSASKNSLHKERYVPSTWKPERGRRFVAPRDEDKKQARRRVNHLVDLGLLPNPNSLMCADCGHPQGNESQRHEYDHYLGYAAEYHESVEAVCSKCHHKRERMRNG